MANEAESLAILTQAGVPVVPHRLCRTAAEAGAAFAALGGPVAVKGCSSGIAHKTELGLVRLNVQDEAGVQSAFEAMSKTIAAAGAAFDGVIVARMLQGRHELMIGAHRDPVFGPVLVVGNGGKYVEAVPDARVLLAPATERDVREQLQRLRIAPVLGGVRGEPPMDTQAFVQAAVAVGRLMQAEPGIDSIDVNPMVLASAREGAFALDAVVFLRG